MLDIVKRLEVARWIAFICMAVDHAGQVFYWGSWSALVGRVAMPLFAICWAAAYAKDDDGSRLYRASLNLAIWGVLAQAVSPLSAHQYSMNALLMFALAGMVWACLLDRLWFAAAVLFLVGSAAVEYWWIGQAFILSALLWWRYSSWRFSALFVFALFVLCWMNGSPFPLISLLAVLLSLYLPIVPRSSINLRHLYPFHLFLLRFLPL